MHDDFSDGESGLGMRAVDYTTCRKLLQSQAARLVVFGGQLVEILDDLLVLAFAKKVLWCLDEANDGDTCNAEHEDQRG